MHIIIRGGRITYSGERVQCSVHQWSEMIGRLVGVLDTSESCDDGIDVVGMIPVPVIIIVLRTDVRHVVIDFDWWHFHCAIYLTKYGLIVSVFLKFSYCEM